MLNSIYYKAYEIVTTKTCQEMTEEEVELVSRTTMFMVNILPKLEPIYDNLPISKGLLKLAKIIGGNNGNKSR